MDEDGNLRPRDESRRQDSPAPRDPRSPQFGAGAPTRPAWSTAHAAAAAADSSRSPRTPPPVPVYTSSWHTPPITPEDLRLQHLDDDAADSHSTPKGRPGSQDLVYRTQGASPPKTELRDLLYRCNGTPEEAREHARSFIQNVAGAQGAPPQMAASTDAATAGAAINGEQEGQNSKKASPSTTIRIGDYPGFKAGGFEPKEMDEWNKAFRNTYGILAVDAARKSGVPARLLAAVSANEMAAEDWTALKAYADRNTLATKSVGPLQIALKTALRYKLVPIENEFYGASPAYRWTALHDPDVRHGQPSSPSGLTPGQKLSYYQDNPHPNNPNGTKIVHDYLDNPTTGFEAGAKLLKIYLQRLADDRQSGAYLNYSKDFRDLTGLSSEKNSIHRDLAIIASGDKEAIHNLHFSPGLAKAIAMMWNNGEDVLNVEGIGAQSPNASMHQKNILWQHEHQNDIIPASGTPLP